MKIIFIGVGEACDERYPNTSLLLSIQSFSGRPQSILFDCGFSVPMYFWKHVNDPNLLDLVWISHFHGDHFLGLPALLLRMWEMGRTKQLVIMGQRDVRRIVTSAMELAYPGFMSRFRFEIRFVECEPGIDMDTIDLQWSFAETEHSRRNLHIALKSPEGTFCYSGDGRPTSESINITKNANILVHEAFHIKPEVPGHGTIYAVIEAARKAEVKYLALVHVQRDVRKWREMEIIRHLYSLNSLQAFLPKTGDLMEL